MTRVPESVGTAAEGARTLARRHFIALWAALLVSGVAVGVIVHVSFRVDHLERAEEDIRIVAELNAANFAYWIDQRLADARMMSENTGYTRRVSRFFDDPYDEVNTAAVTERLLGEHRYHRFSSVQLFDPEGAEKLAVPGPREVDRSISDAVDRAFALPGRIDLGVVHTVPGGAVEVPIAVPLSIAEGDAEQVHAVCVFHVDLTRYGFPLLEQWPGSSRSGEMLLTRLSGSGYDILSPRRFDPPGADPILTVDLLDPTSARLFRLADPGATLWHRDYREAEVLAAVAAVDGTPWLVQAKMDHDEVWAPIRGHLIYVVAVVILWSAAVTLGVGLLWRSRLQEQRLAAARVARAESVARELADMNQLLEEANEVKSAFLASMSHELRTPLNSIIGFSGILAGGIAGQLTLEQRTQAEMINSSGRHLLSLIEGVLEFAKVEAGKLEVRTGSLEIMELAGGVVEALRPLADEKGLALSLHSEGSLGLVSDEVKVRQILFNLIGNAIKFTSDGGVAVLLARAADGGAVISVRDTGPGIHESQLVNLFDPFVQVEPPGGIKPSGTGLGLAVSREYARMLGGEVSVRTRVGEGSTFELHLPDMEA